MKAIFFDLDETLLDRVASLNDFVGWQARDVLGLPSQVAEQFIQRFIALDANGTVWKDRVYQVLLDEFPLSQWSVATLLTMYEQDFYKFCKLMQGVVDAIQQIQKMGLKIGLISNGKSPFQERNFEALGLSSYFEVVIVSDKVGLRKPQPEIFELACEQMGVQASMSFFVGDNPVADIEGANNAGLYSIQYVRDSADVVTTARFSFTNFAQLPNHIRRLL